VLIPFPPRVKPLAPVLLVLLGAIAAISAYLQALDFQFVSDDRIYIVENQKLASLSSVDLWRLFVEPYNPYEFLPLRDFSYWLDLSMHGLNPAAFRLHNIFLYVLCLPLVYGLTSALWRYLRPSDAENSPWIAAAVTVLFAINPAHVEAVVWASGRKDILAGLFSLLALWLAIKARRVQGFSSGYATAALFALAGAILSKATSVMISPIIAIFWLLFWLDDLPTARKRLLLVWPAVSLLLAGYMAVVFTANSTIREPVRFGTDGIVRALTVLGDLLRLAVTPESRHFFYPGLDDPNYKMMVVLGVSLLVFAVAGAVMFIRRRSLVGAALGMFVLLCVPYMQLIPYRTPSLVVDRFVYLAVWPAALIIVAFAWRCKPLVRNSIIVAVALGWGLQTMERPQDWQSSETMIDADLNGEPGYYMPAFQKIMWVQLKRGQFQQARETAGNINDTAIGRSIIALIDAKHAVQTEAANAGNPSGAISRLRDFETALARLSGRSAVNPSVQYVWKYSRIELVDQWKYLADLFPENIPVRLNTGMRLLHIDMDYDAAAVHLRAATGSQLLPQYVRGSALKDLGMALLYSRHFAEAEATLRAALEEVSPDLQVHCLIEELYRETGRNELSASSGAICRGLGK